MFTKLFSQSGLSLDRLKALVEVGAAGSIVQAAGSDPARQSQYSRQIKELEDFFQIGLVERHGKGIRLTAGGKELARISRFFLLGLSNFQRGCIAEGQTYRIGGGATFIATFLLPLLAEPAPVKSGIRYSVETVQEEDIERRLHELTLDFGIVNRPALSRPLQLRELGSWKVVLWVPKTLCRTEKEALREQAAHRLPIAWPQQEMPRQKFEAYTNYEPSLICGSFLEARAALQQQGLAAVLPGFLAPAQPASRYWQMPLRGQDSAEFQYYLAWNPRLLRLNPHAARRRDALGGALAKLLSGKS
jgi:DNA-binding transcriptional LysR family regulator